MTHNDFLNELTTLLEKYDGTISPNIDSQVYMWTEGSFSCDCNLVDFLADSKQEERSEEVCCGETDPVVRLVLIRTDRTELEIYNAE